MFNITLDQLSYLANQNGNPTHAPEDLRPAPPSAIESAYLYGGFSSVVGPAFPTEILAGSWASVQAEATAYTCKQEESGQSLTGE